MKKLVGVSVGPDYIDVELGRENHGLGAPRFKRDFLLFDHVAIPGISSFLSTFHDRFSLLRTSLTDCTADLIRHFYAEIEYLVETGFLIDPSIQLEHLIAINPSYWRQKTLRWNPLLYQYDLFEAEGDIKFRSRMPLVDVEIDTHVVTGTAQFLNRNADVHAIPLAIKGPIDLDPLIRPGDKDVIRVVIERFPVPSELVDWPSIVAFKSDTEAAHRRLKLRKWIRDVAVRVSEMSEIEEELLDLLNDYRRFMELHIAQLQTKRLEVLVSSIPEVVENIVKFRLAKLAKMPFSLRQHRINLEIAELSAPGKEVSYIPYATRFFGKD
ncbi:hypothetical protein ACFL4G_13420 [Thermodesulfobacteriota bacterium]